MLKISLLSPFALTRDGQPLKLPSRRTESLLIYLVCNPQLHARDVLASLFWDDMPQKKAMGNLRVLLANLRKELEPYVIITRKTAGINLDAEIEVDTFELEEALSTSRAAIDKRGKLTKEEAADLSQALQLFQSTLLPGFYLKDGFGFEEWLATEREWLWTRVVEAVDDLAAEYLQLGEYRAGIEQAQQLVNLDPLREEGHQLLMQLWAADNQISAALNQYTRCQEILDQELGTSPHPFTTELYAQISSGEWQLPARKSEDGAAPARPIPHNLPRPITQLIGRDRDLDLLLPQLLDETVPTLSIVGPGGIGKTTLAIELGRQLVDQQQKYFEDGIFFVPLASVNEHAQIPPVLAESLGYTFMEKGGDEQTQIMSYLETKSLLLIFDNAEQLVDQTDIFSEILAAAPRVKLLVTSRHQLNLPSETIFLLDGLTYPTSEEPADSLTQYSSVQLFMSRLQRKSGRLNLEEASVLAIGQICRLVQGMPLAVKLAAANGQMLTPVEIAAELESSVGSLQTEQDEVVARQQNMQAVFDQSWELLSKGEQQVFARMSVFRSGCLRSIAQAVTGGSLRDLLSLTQKSLLTRDISTGRFSIHTLLRQMAAEKLAKLGQSAKPLHKLAVETIEKTFSAELSPFYAELAVHAEHAALADTARHYYILAAEQARSLFQNNVAIDYFGRAMTFTPAESKKSRFTLHTQRQDIFHLLGRRDEQLAEIILMGDIADELNDNGMRCTVAIRKARHAEALGEYGKSAGHAEQAVNCAKDAGANHQCAESYFVWGNALSRDGKFDLAKDKLERAVTLAKGANLPLLAAQSYQILGIDSVYQMRYDMAKLYFEHNVAIFQRLDNKAAQAAGLGNLGVLMIYQGDYRGSLTYLEQAVEIFREVGDIRNETIGLINIGSNAIKLQAFAKAEQYLRQALAITHKTDDFQSRREAHNWLGHLFSDQGNYAEAEIHYEKALGLAEGMAVADYIIETRVALAGLAAKRDKKGSNLLIEDLVNQITLDDLAQADDAVRVFLNSYFALNSTDPNRAAELLKIAHSHLKEIAAQFTDAQLKNEFWQKVFVHKQILDLVNSLGPR